MSDRYGEATFVRYIVVRIECPALCVSLGTRWAITHNGGFGFFFVARKMVYSKFGL